MPNPNDVLNAPCAWCRKPFYKPSLIEKYIGRGKFIKVCKTCDPIVEKQSVNVFNNFSRRCGTAIEKEAGNQ